MPEVTQILTKHPQIEIGYHKGKSARIDHRRIMFIVKTELRAFNDKQFIDTK